MRVSALDDALGGLEWIRAVWSELTDPLTSVADESSRLGSQESYVVVRRLGPEMPSFAVTDARGLYDHLGRPSGATGSSSDRRSKIDISVLSQSMKAVNGQITWLPNEIMVSDCLTKKTGNSALLRYIMQQAKFALRKDGVSSLLSNFCNESQMRSLQAWRLHTVNGLF